MQIDSSAKFNLLVRYVINFILTKKKKILFFYRNNTQTTPFPIHFEIQHTDIVRVKPSSVTINTTGDSSIEITVEAIGAGHSEVAANATATI